MTLWRAVGTRLMTDNQPGPLAALSPRGAGQQEACDKLQSSSFTSSYASTGFGAATCVSPVTLQSEMVTPSTPAAR